MKTSVSQSIIIRVRMPNESGVLSQLLTIISDLDGQVGAIDIIKIEEGIITRDITINTSGEDHIHKIMNALEALKSVQLRHMSDRTFLLHLGGKIEVKSK
ncbi:MAG: ACT domain-containing protein, partial [Coxiellaceae bacterium]|nr:ACT domain-containing protein [Coxiellaceae bacterium]